jgi:signal transduction histidine kinase
MIAMTEIPGAQAHAEAGQLAHEYAALRRVVTLVAQDAPSNELFHAVAREVGTLLGGDFAEVARFDGNAAVGVGVWAAHGELAPVPPCRRMREGDPATTIARVRKAARWDDWTRFPRAVAEFIHDTVGVRSSVGTPIVVEGRLWGALALHSRRAASFPPETASRMAQFTDLVGTAVANAEARAEVQRLAEEQAALRRVATLVKQGAPPTAVFDAVAAEMHALLGADAVTLCRYEPRDEATVVAYHGPNRSLVAPGTRVRCEGNNITTLVRRSEWPARIEDHADADGPVAELVREPGIRTSVGTPIVVDGRPWGLASANWQGDDLPPPETEQRMTRFAQLLDAAIANADSREQLTASRARLLSASDEARRRVVRDLHDGAQQRLVHTVVTLKLAQRALRQKDGGAASLVAEALEQAEQANDELRELAHGIIPPVLSRGGLLSGVRRLAERSHVPVEIDVTPQRFLPALEASAYFIVAEALTNVAKHSHATRARVTARAESGMLRLEIRDDGIGGADREGHGLVGLADRAAALGGRLAVEGPVGGGTMLTATLPL